MNVIRERNGQALVKYDVKGTTGKKNDMRFEWWFNTEKMRKGVKLEEQDGKTHIYCYEFKGSYRELWLMEEFDRRVPKHKVV
jgi:hypothetical protein